jgi:hypothetical protein
MGLSSLCRGEGSIKIGAYWPYTPSPSPVGEQTRVKYKLIPKAGQFGSAPMRLHEHFGCNRPLGVGRSCHRQR